jgi:hypothetical protein
MNVKLGLGPRNSYKRNTEMGFSLQCIIWPHGQIMVFLELFFVCLSSRLQRGYNGVERAEFQRRE